MVYLDNNNTCWEVCVFKNDNSIIDVDFCGNKFQLEPESSELTHRFNQIVQSINTTNKSIDVINDTYLPEFKIIINAIIKQEISYESDINNFVETCTIQDGITTINLVGSWKVIYIESKKENSIISQV
jgi:hypothetical protein